MEIKQWIKEKICKYFGHDEFEEVFAERCDNLFGYNMPIDPKTGLGSGKHYIVFHQFTCRRCGRIMSSESRPMRRSQMLKDGWFLKNNNYERK